MVTLEQITMDNFEECLKLMVKDEQRSFVASVSYSLSEAFADKVSKPYAVYADAQMVGFVMYDYADDRHTAFITRLLIDARFQGYGYGRCALELVISEICEIEGCERISISYNKRNTVAAALYEKLGFNLTGEIASDGEIMRELVLHRR